MESSEQNLVVAIRSTISVKFFEITCYTNISKSKTIFELPKFPVIRFFREKNQSKSFFQRGALFYTDQIKDQYPVILRLYF